MTDVHLRTYMHIAYEQARIAYAQNEVPVGAVIVHNAHIISTAHNTTECDSNSLRHAEIIALNTAMQALGAKRLPECDLYVTMEPCTMCAGAIAHARIRTLIYGCYDPKAGAIEHGTKVFQNTTIHHRPTIIGGVMEQECATILQNFFKEKRL